MSKTVAVVLTLGFLASVAASVAICARYAPGLTQWMLFQDADPIGKLVMMLCIPLAIVAAILAVVPSAGVKGGLVIFAIAGPLLGGLAALYGMMVIGAVEAEIGPVSFGVKAPGIAEQLLTLAFGLFVGAVAALGLLRKRA